LRIRKNCSIFCHFKSNYRRSHKVKNIFIDRIFFYKNRKEMLKTNSILSENFLNAVQTAYTLQAELNRPAENRRQQSRA